MRENVDDLFALDADLAAAPDVFPPDKFNAGVLVVKPDAATHARPPRADARTRRRRGGETIAGTRRRRGGETVDRPRRRRGGETVEGMRRAGDAGGSGVATPRREIVRRAAAAAQIAPSAQARLLALAPTAPSHDGGDTGFLNHCFPAWFAGDSSSRLARLPFQYNAQRTLYWMTHAAAPGYWDAVKPIKILHFSSAPKPWQAPDRKGDLEMIWWECFLAAQLSPC